MCFYDQHTFVCGNWKWVHFRQHCDKELRIGETCGMKILFQTVPTGTLCKLCEKINTKMRRRAAEVDRISRWQRADLKLQALFVNTADRIRALDEEISELQRESSRR
ncbi:hypothetical protein COCMIDRAFT_54488, partial [Bipolaris oryzae ATCC 44560]